MEWAADAEAALKRVPFFVRQRVRTRVEEKTRDSGNFNALPAVFARPRFDTASVVTTLISEPFRTQLP